MEGSALEWSGSQ